MNDPHSLEGIHGIPDPVAPVTVLASVPLLRLPQSASPTRAERHRRVRLAMAGACAWLAGMTTLLGVRSDWASPRALVPLTAGMLTLVLGLVAVLRPRARGLPPGIRVVQHALWVVPGLYVSVVLLAGAGTARVGGNTGVCLVSAMAMALGPLATAAFLLRGSFPSAQGWRGAAVGVLVGLAGALGVHVHCEQPAVLHGLAGHAPVLLLAALVGWVLGLFRGRA